MIVDWPYEKYLTKQMFLPNNPVIRFHALSFILQITHDSIDYKYLSAAIPLRQGPTVARQKQASHQSLE